MRNKGEGEGEMDMEMEFKPWVLVVDDDEDICWAVQVVLCRHGLRTVGASSALVALEILRRSSPPAVIVLDLRMPIMSGEDLVARVRADAALANVRIVGMSGDVGGVDIARELRLDDYLVKPVDISRLVGAVERAVSTRVDEHGVRAGA